MDGLNFKHYITVDEQGYITDGWSDGPYPDRDTTGAVCINERGGYQVRLARNGSENPALCDAEGNPLYMWDGANVVEVT